MKSTFRARVIMTSLVTVSLLAAAEAEAGYAVTVTDCRTGRAISGATVTALTADSVPDRPRQVRTGVDGSSLIYPYPADRPHQLSLSAPGYQTTSKNVFISSQSILKETVCLAPVAASAPSNSATIKSAGASPPAVSSRTTDASQTIDSPQTAGSSQVGASTDWSQQDPGRGNQSWKLDTPQVSPGVMARDAQDRAAKLGGGALDLPPVPFPMDPTPPSATDDAISRLGNLIAQQSRPGGARDALRDPPVGPGVPVESGPVAAGSDGVSSQLDKVETMLDDVAQILAKLEAKLDRDMARPSGPGEGLVSNDDAPGRAGNAAARAAKDSQRAERAKDDAAADAEEAAGLAREAATSAAAAVQLAANGLIDWKDAAAALQQAQEAGAAAAQAQAAADRADVDYQGADVNAVAAKFAAADGNPNEAEEDARVAKMAADNADKNRSAAQSERIEAQNKAAAAEDTVRRALSGNR